MIHWYPKQILLHCEEAEKCIFNAFLIVPRQLKPWISWNVLRWIWGVSGQKIFFGVKFVSSRIYSESKVESQSRKFSHFPDRFGGGVGVNPSSQPERFFTEFFFMTSLKIASNLFQSEEWFKLRLYTLGPLCLWQCF